MSDPRHDLIEMAAIAKKSTDECIRLMGLLRSIGLECFDAMENCDEPHFSRYSRIVSWCEEAATEGKVK